MRKLKRIKKARTAATRSCSGSTFLPIVLSAVMMTVISFRVSFARYAWVFQNPPTLTVTIDVRTLDGISKENSLATKNTTTATAVIPAATEAPKEPEPIPFHNMSVLKYGACCGMGHRLARQAPAYHAAHLMGVRLEPNWGYCGKEIHREGDIFESLFEADTDLSYVTSTGLQYVVKNEVPGCHPADHACTQDSIHHAHSMYASLQKRFKFHHELKPFLLKHKFASKLVLGLHVRAGNGEVAYTNDNREMTKTSAPDYVRSVSNHIQSFLFEARKSHERLPPPLLFIATDTAEYVELFRTELEGIMPVVDYDEQERAQTGNGVWFKHRGTGGFNGTTKCLQNWHDMALDMILLAQTDVLISGQYSSFSQTMPLSLVLGRQGQDRKLPLAYCEVFSEGKGFACHKTTMEWCMNSRQKNVLKTLSSVQKFRDSYKNDYGEPKTLREVRERQRQRQSS